MSNEALANWLAVVALFGVGLNLYWDRQIMRAEVAQNMADKTIDVTLAWADGDNAELFDKIINDTPASELSPSEAAKARLLYAASLRAAESRYRIGNAVDLRGETEEWFGGSAEIYRTRYLVDTWRELRNILTDDFAKEFEKRHSLTTATRKQKSLDLDADAPTETQPTTEANEAG